MRRIYLTITMTVLLLAGGHCAFAKKSKTIEVETAKFAKSDSTAEVSVLVQWPVNGDKIIVDSLRHHINYLLGDELNRPDDVKAYGESLFESLSLDFTFRKSDGKQIKLLENTDSPELAKLVKEGIKSFFAGGPDKTMSDEEVLEFLFASEAEELDNIPLPLNNPYLSDTGVVFLYTQYEIAPYSSGIITFEIPFAKILPFLTKEAKDMIK